MLTDGGLFYGPDGELLKRFDVKDGHGIVLAATSGIPAAILTARTSRIVERAPGARLAAVLQGRKDKAAGFRALCAQLSVDPATCAYMGDDLNDLGVMERVGLSACPSDAAPEVRATATFVACSLGGHGAVRELTELCLKGSARWERALYHVRGNLSSR